MNNMDKVKVFTGELGDNFDERINRFLEQEKATIISTSTAIVAHQHRGMVQTIVVAYRTYQVSMTDQINSMGVE